MVPFWSCGPAPGGSRRRSITGFPFFVFGGKKLGGRAHARGAHGAGSAPGRRRVSWRAGRCRGAPRLTELCAPRPVALAAASASLPLCLSASLSLSVCVSVSVCLPLSLTASLGAVRWSSLHGQAVWCFSTPSLSPRFQAQSVAAADASKHCFLRCCFSLAALAGRLGRKLQLGQVVGLMASEVCASRVQLAADVYEV